MAAAGQLTCGLCAEDKRETTPHFATRDDDSFVCRECAEEHILPLFENALEHNHHYPPRWGAMLQGEPMDIAAFEDIMSDQFVRRYRTKEIEYNTPPIERVYCPHTIVLNAPRGEVLNARDVVNPQDFKTDRCNAFMGSNRADHGPRACRECDGYVCIPCGSLLTSQDEQHTCPSETQAEKEKKEEDEVFGALERGVDYQECPYCSKKIQLSEACNEMTCTCTEHFCFVCGRGVPVPERRNHWKMGGCPRWNAIATATADDYDPDVAEEDDDAAAGLNAVLALPVHLPAATQAQQQEALQLSLADADNDDAGLPEHAFGFPATYGYYLPLVVQRDILSREIDEIRATGLGLENVHVLQWLIIIHMLETLKESVVALMPVLRLPVNDMPAYIAMFDTNQDRILADVEHIPPIYLQSRQHIVDILQIRFMDVSRVLQFFRHRVANHAN